MENTITNEIRTLEKNSFPTLLKEITDPPKQLFVRGELPHEKEENAPKNSQTKYLCVVGARKNTRYGKEVCQSLVIGLRGYDIVIVSGLALGMDAIAHEAALSAGLTTIAVPGSGLSPSVLYPVENRSLAERILASGGALISEFENDFKARPESFPQRNRIMAGMCHAVLVVEAEMRSGTLITSRLATEYNRDVFTVPGSIFSTKSEGPHMLMRLGATPVRNSEDILLALGLVSENDELVHKGKGGKNKNKKTVEKESLKIKIKRLQKNCSKDEKMIISMLESPLSRTELVSELNQLGTSITDTIIALSLLELKGFVHESMGELRLK